MQRHQYHEQLLPCSTRRSHVEPLSDVGSSVQRGPARAERQMSYRDDLLPQWATKYYVAGRLAARASLSPIHGNLLHHAVEMYLKYVLIGVVSPGQMRSREFGHNLEWLWQRFKEREADSALDRCGATVYALCECEGH